tara:strand:- start:31789 stop:33735 length:1947 start_codon:yes stop_codon:yes gene_type:complete
VASFKVKRPALLKRAVFDGYDYGLVLHFVQGAGRLLQQFGGSYIGDADHPCYRAWRIPKAKLHTEPEELFTKLMELADGQCRESYESFIQKLDAARASPRLDAFLWGMKLQLFPLTDGGALSIGDYHPAVVALYRSLRGLFLPPMRGWRLDSSLEFIYEQLIAEVGLSEDQVEISGIPRTLHSDGTVSVESDVVSLKVGGESPERSAQGEDGANEVYLADVPHMFAHTWEADELDHAIEPFSLYDYQTVGVRFLVTRSSALLADDMGLGKTRQALTASLIQAKGGRILIITLASLILNIEREIRLIQPDAAVSLQTDDPSCQWVVTNYERLGAFVLVAAGFSVMVIDEAHRLKEPTAECTKHAFDIAAQIPNRYLLTGTPVLNREAELHTLLRLSGHPIGQMQLREFCEQFAGSKEFRNALRERLADWMLRRRKDVLPQLKGKHRQPFSIEMNDAERNEYQSILGGADTPLVRIGQLRRLLERAKVASIVDRLCQMGPDDKAIVFCEFKETVAVIEECCANAGIVTASLMGHHNGKRRQAAVDRFQEDPDCRVFVGTTKAAGTGINLTAANYVLFCSLPWTPALQAQAEDRAYRNGQLRPVMVLLPLVESSIDQQLWQMLLSKQALASDLLEPEQAAEDAMRQLAAVA